MIIDSKFNFEECVFLITDDEQRLRLVTGIQVTKNTIIYRLAYGVNESWHYDFEISKDKNYLI